MRQPAARGRRDANQAEIVRVLRQCGARVKDASGLGGGFPDLVVLYRGIVRLVEVKTAKGKIRKSQLDFSGEWPVWLARSEDEAVQLVRAWQHVD